MVLSHGRSTSQPRSLREKCVKKGIYSSILDRFQTDEVFHANQLQHNWTKEMVRIFGLLRCNIFGTIRNKWKEDSKKKKTSRLPSNVTSFRKHEQRKQVRFKNQKDVTIAARIWTQRSSTGLNGSLTIGNGTSR